MTTTPPTNLQGNHTSNIPSSSSTSGPTFSPGSISIATDIADVDKLELESYSQRCKKLKEALEAQQLVVKKQLTDNEVTDIERRVDAEEAAGRVKAKAITITSISGGTESVSLSTLSHSYRLIRNLLWIEQHPVYKKALAEWEGEENLFASRIARKLDRRRALQNDVYQMIGFYSVFQGVLLTASSQSSYLRCRNVGLPIALSAFASFGTLMHIRRKLEVSLELQKTIISEDFFLKVLRSLCLSDLVSISALYHKHVISVLQRVGV